MQGLKNSFSGVIRYFFFPRDDDAHTLSITPYRDWCALVVISACSFIVLICIGGYLFFVVSGSNVFNNKDRANAPDSVNKQGLEKALSLFKEKEGRWDKLFNVTPSIVDPSL